MIRPSALGGFLLLLGLSVGAPDRANAAEAACREQTVIVADTVTYDFRQEIITATGQVHLIRDGRNLTAEQILYHRAEGRIEIPGPFRSTSPNGDILEGRQAEYDERLARGEIIEVRARLSGEVGILTAATAAQEEGRGLTLEKAQYSPCPVSETDPTPAWQIHADRIEHDRENRDLIFTNARFDAFGVPVGWMPAFRMPDPSVKRRSGFLVPTVHRGVTYGLAFRAPYYLALDPDREAYLTAFMTAREGAILEGKYQQLLPDGNLTSGGSLTHKFLSDSTDSGFRGHFVLDAEIRPDPTTTMGTELNVASHQGYLRRYEYSDSDRLRNRFFFEHYDDEEILEGEILAFQSHRDGERSRTLPILLPNLFYQRRLPGPRPIRGVLSLGSHARVLRRIDGRDVATLGVEAGWERQGLLSPTGVRLTVYGNARAERIWVSDQPDNAQPGYETTTPSYSETGLEVVWPLIRVGSFGADLLEPFAQVTLSPNRTSQEEVPNEDSLDVEFDEFSLLSRNRFTGRDRFETGLRMATGLHYALALRQGIRFEAIGGQVFREQALTTFTRGSGLRGPASDYVGAWSLSLRDPISLNLLHRLRLAKNFEVQRSDLSLRSNWQNIGFKGTYVFLEGDPDAPPETLEHLPRGEFQSEVALQINPSWHLALNYRLDTRRDRSISVGSEIRYAHPCFQLRIGVERNYNGSINAPPGTEVGLQIELLTFDSDRSENG